MILDAFFNLTDSMILYRLRHTQKISHICTIVMIENSLRPGKQWQIIWLVGPSISRELANGLNEKMGSYLVEIGNKKWEYNTNVVKLFQCEWEYKSGYSYGVLFLLPIITSL